MCLIIENNGNLNCNCKLSRRISRRVSRTSVVVVSLTETVKNAFEFNSSLLSKWRCGVEGFCNSDSCYLTIVGIHNSIDCVTYKLRQVVCIWSALVGCMGVQHLWIVESTFTVIGNKPCERKFSVAPNVYVDWSSWVHWKWYFVKVVIGTKLLDKLLLIPTVRVCPSIHFWPSHFNSLDLHLIRVVK